MLKVFDLEGNDGLVKKLSSLHGRRVDIPPLEKLKIVDSKVFWERIC